VPPLDATARARLPDSAFAYVDSQGRRRLPINDASHVRNALARFDQVDFEDDVARERARERLLRAAKKHGIVPLGFFDGQLRKARTSTVRSLPRGTVTFLLTDIEGSTRLLERLGDDYAALLRDVRGLIRTSVRAASGLEVDARADEFFAVFRRPAAALEAALAIQRELREKSACASACTPAGRRSPTRVMSASPSTSPHGSAGRATVARSCFRPRHISPSPSVSPRESLSEVSVASPSTALPSPRRSFKFTSPTCAANSLDRARSDRRDARGLALLSHANQIVRAIPDSRS